MRIYLMEKRILYTDEEDSRLDLHDLKSAFMSINELPA